MPYPEGHNDRERTEELVADSPKNLTRLAASFLVQGDGFSVDQGNHAMAVECYTKSLAFIGLAIGAQAPALTLSQQEMFRSFDL